MSNIELLALITCTHYLRRGETIIAGEPARRRAPVETAAAG